MTPAELDDAWHGLQFDVRRSVRYHRRRQSLFERLYLAINTLLVLLIGIAIPDKLALTAAATLIAMMAVALLGVPHQDQIHAGLARRFIELECQLLAEPTPDLLQQMSAARLTIEMDGPPVLRVLDALCHNEQLRAQDQLEYRVRPITWLQRLFAQWFDIHPERSIPPARD